MPISAQVHGSPLIGYRCAMSNDPNQPDQPNPNETPAERDERERRDRERQTPRQS